MSPAASLSFGGLPVALQALHSLHLPFKQRPPTPATKLASRLVAVQRDLGALHIARAVDLKDEIDQLQPNGRISGAWQKDKEASDSMQDAVEMVQLNFILQKALVLLNRLVLEESPTHFETRLKAGGPLDVVERYPFTGEVVEHSRRDKRRGRHRGRVLRDADGHPCIAVTWDDPYGGECTDTFVLSQDGTTLRQVTDMTVTGRHTRYTTVYRRVHGG